MPDKNTPLDQIPDSIRSEGAVAFRDLASTLYSVAGAANVGKKSLKPLELYAKTGDSLVKKIKDLDQKIHSIEKAANYLDNKPLVGPIAKALKPVAKGLATWSANTKAELINLSETQRKIGAVIEPIAKTLNDIDKYGLIAGVAADTFSRKLAVAGQQLADAKQLFDTDIPFFGNDSNVKQKILLRISEAGAEASEVALEVSQVTATLDGIVDAGKELTNFVENPVFQIIEEFSDAITAVGNALSPVFTPIQKVYNALEPVLDALDSIFGWFLKPLEWALDAIIEATGINSLIEAVANELLKILPDTSFLSGIIAELERVFLEDMKEFYEQKIETPFNAVKAKLDDVNFPNQFSVATEGDDTLMGALNASGALTLDALGGDDILLGSQYGDTLRGGAGLDILVGGGGNDLLDGGANPANEPDMAMYTGSINDYGIVSILENGFASGTWFVTDLRDDTSIEGISDRINLGTDELRGIEVLVFDDGILDLRKIDTYIQTRSGPGELAKITPTSTTLEIAGKKIFTADGGVDLIFGALGFDILETGAGNDQLTSGSNDPLTVTSREAEGDILRGGLGNDIYLPGPRSGDKDFIEDEGGNDTVDYNLSEYGLNVFLGKTARELLYRPYSISIEVDTIGRSQDGQNYPIGKIVGIENIIGTKFADVIIGSDGINKISGGAGNDQIRGLDGDDILLGGDGNDILIGDGGNDYMEGGSGFNTYVAGLGNDYIVDLSGSHSLIYYATSDNTNSSLGVEFVDFATRGDDSFTPNNMPGGIVIVPSDIPHKQQVSKYKTSVEIGDRFGVDDLEGIERIVATKGRDIIYTAEGINQTIYGNDGNDDLFTLGSTENRLYGGSGDDLFISSPDAKDTFFGGDGNDTVRIWGDNTVGFGVDGDKFFGHENRQQTTSDIDTLDFSQSDYSWHMYFNPFSSGVLTGKSPLTGLFDADPRFTQPTLGVNGVVSKLPGVQRSGEVYPGVVYELQVADPNTSAPGGWTTSIGEFNRIIGSQHRDFITGGSARSAITIDGQGGDDVLFASQRFASLVDGGDGNDVLGTFNHTLGNERPERYFDPELLAVLNGGKGDDTFVAGDFREQIDGGEGINLLTYEVSTSGVTVDLTTKALDRGYATGDILVGGIINVIGSQFDDIITGDDQLNELVGWDGNDIIRGMDGSDQLYGNDGDDHLFGGAGSDVLHGGNGADLLDGGEGNDTASWSLYQVHPKAGINRLTNDTSGVIADLKTGKAGLDTLVNIENLIGGVGDDQFFGNDDDNFLGGAAGNDLLDGRGGNDVIIGARGDDILRGGDGDDFLSGGAGNNELDGGEGTDSIDYSSLVYGVTVVMAGAGARAALATGEVNSLTPVDAYVWTDSLTTVPGPTGLPDDVIESGTNETRYTYQFVNFGFGDPIRKQEDPITPERIWKLNPQFAETPDDLIEVRFLPNEGLLAEQEVSLVQEYVTSRDIFTSIERIIGGKGNDNFVGNAEDTFFYGGAGADVIDGGDGIDIARYQGQKAGFLISNNGLDITVKDLVGEEGTDTLVNVERLVFGDSGLAFDLDGNAGLVAKLLVSMLGKDNWRIPEYVSIGLDVLDSAAMSFEELMSVSLETVLGQNPTNEAVVNLLYSNLVGVKPPQAELELFAGLIADGTYTQASLAVSSASHPVTEEYIQLIGLADTGLEYSLS